MDPFQEDNSHDDPFGVSSEPVSHDADSNHAADHGYSFDNDNEAPSAASNNSNSNANSWNSAAQPAEEEEEQAVDEDAKFREWENKHNEELIEKDGAEYDSIDNLRREAREALLKVAEERSERIRGVQSTNATEEKTFKSQIEGGLNAGSVWERAVGLVDLQLKTERRDVGRMKQVLLRLKNENM
eukprot:ANDGO_02557.mRNA.1 uncharacterized protein